VALKQLKTGSKISLNPAQNNPESSAGFNRFSADFTLRISATGHHRLGHKKPRILEKIIARSRIQQAQTAIIFIVNIF
jgi:hypothetical protein